MIADYTCGGPHVNPSVTTAMLVWKKITPAQWLLNVSAQMAGGVLAFPIVQGISNIYGVKIGGPEFSGNVLEGMKNECIATFILLAGIFVFCTTAIGRIYSVKQPLVAGTIRYCCVFYNATGPALNPMLATTWTFYKRGQAYPTDPGHYAVYWIGSMGGAAAAALIWSTLSLLWRGSEKKNKRA